MDTTMKIFTAGDDLMFQYPEKFSEKMTGFLE
jgi:hypothetical protein